MLLSLKRYSNMPHISFISYLLVSVYMWLPHFTLWYHWIQFILYTIKVISYLIKQLHFSTKSSPLTRMVFFLSQWSLVMCCFHLSLQILWHVAVFTVFEPLAQIIHLLISSSLNFLNIVLIITTFLLLLWIARLNTNMPVPYWTSEHLCLGV